MPGLANSAQGQPCIITPSVYRTLAYMIIIVHITSNP